ncbi:hypothetical protein FXO38_13545 [Capsicum annuum]|nr:hypothetical protein FXO38_13545 [Capsicum annuum]
MLIWDMKLNWVQTWMDSRVLLVMSGNYGGGEADQWWSFGLADPVAVSFSVGGWGSDGVTHFSDGGWRLRGEAAVVLFEGCWWCRAWSEMDSFGLTTRAASGARLAGAWVFLWF